jgi:hypothetical protein
VVWHVQQRRQQQLAFSGGPRAGHLHVRRRRRRCAMLTLPACVCALDLEHARECCTAPSALRSDRRADQAIGRIDRRANQIDRSTGTSQSTDCACLPLFSISDICPCVLPVGKTMLMDLLVHAAPPEFKVRTRLCQPLVVCCKHPLGMYGCPGLSRLWHVPCWSGLTSTPPCIFTLEVHKALQFALKP